MLNRPELLRIGRVAQLYQARRHFAALDSTAKIDHVFEMRDLGKMLMIFGIALVFIGFALWSGVGAGWLGRLPGDIRIERGNSAFYFPIVTCIIISIVLSLIFSLSRR